MKVPSRVDASLRLFSMGDEALETEFSFLAIVALHRARDAGKGDKIEKWRIDCW